MARRARAGTAIRKSWDARRIGKALAHQGADLRHWVSYATVAAVDDDGEVDLSNPNAIVISPAGIDVDVVLEPSGHPCTCTHGIAAGTVFVCGPIKVGDQVVVGIPDGDVSMVPRILAVIADGDANVVPVGADGKPIFQNDRFLVYAAGVPIDLRSTDGEHTSTVLVNPDGSIILNGGTAGVARKGDSTKLNMSPTDVEHLATALLATGGFSPGGPPGPGTAIEFDGGAITGSSDTVKAG